MSDNCATNTAVEFDVPDIPNAQRIDLAYLAVQNGQLSMRKAAAHYGVNYSTLQGRCTNGAISKVQASQAMQRLSVGEEECLRDWLLQLASWGWPARVDQLRGMATELLRAKGDYKELGIH